MPFFLERMSIRSTLLSVLSDLVRPSHGSCIVTFIRPPVRLFHYPSSLSSACSTVCCHLPFHPIGLFFSSSILHFTVLQFVHPSVRISFCPSAHSTIFFTANISYQSFVLPFICSPLCLSFCLCPSQTVLSYRPFVLSFIFPFICLSFRLSPNTTVLQFL